MDLVKCVLWLLRLTIPDKTCLDHSRFNQTVKTEVDRIGSLWDDLAIFRCLVSLKCHFENRYRIQWYPTLRVEFLGHLCHSGDLLLWVGVRRRALFVVRRALTSSSQELLGQS